MKAITVWQPWASLIAAGFKPYEFRSRPFTEYIDAPAIGETIGIHAGARKVRRSELQDLILRLRSPDEAWSTALRPDALPLLEKVYSGEIVLPVSQVVCLARLGTPVPAERIAGDLGAHAIADSDRAAHWNCAWPLTDIVSLPPGDPVSGRQGFFEWRP